MINGPVYRQSAYHLSQDLWKKIYLTHYVTMHLEALIYRGYYTVARRYEYYFRVVKTIFYEQVQRVSKILFVPRENNVHIFKPPCNVLFII